jgi:hypothetical protein
MCHYCYQSGCSDRNKICGYNPQFRRAPEPYSVSYEEDGTPIYDGNPPEGLVKRLLEKEVVNVLDVG